MRWHEPCIYNADFLLHSVGTWDSAAASNLNIAPGAPADPDRIHEDEYDAVRLHSCLYIFLLSRQFYPCYLSQSPRSLFLSLLFLIEIPFRDCEYVTCIFFFWIGAGQRPFKKNQRCKGSCRRSGQCIPAYAWKKEDEKEAVWGKHWCSRPSGTA